jgi:hypothetical protein
MFFSGFGVVVFTLIFSTKFLNSVYCQSTNNRLKHKTLNIISKHVFRTFGGLLLIIIIPNISFSIMPSFSGNIVPIIKKVSDMTAKPQKDKKKTLLELKPTQEEIKLLPKVSMEIKPSRNLTNTLITYNDLHSFPLNKESDARALITELITRKKMIFTQSRHTHIFPENFNPKICVFGQDCQWNIYETTVLLKSEFDALKKILKDKVDIIGACSAASYEKIALAIQEELNEKTANEIKYTNKLANEEAKEIPNSSMIKYYRGLLDKIERNKPVLQKMLNRLKKREIVFAQITPKENYGLNTFSVASYIPDMNPKNESRGRYIFYDKLFQLMKTLKQIPFAKSRDEAGEAIYVLSEGDNVPIYRTMVQILEHNAEIINNKPNEEDIDNRLIDAFKAYFEKKNIPYFMHQTTYSSLNFFYPAYVSITGQSHIETYDITAELIYKQTRPIYGGGKFFTYWYATKIAPEDR